MPRKATYAFRDKNGKVGEASLWLPDLPSFALLDNVLIAMGIRMAALSNASLESATLDLKYSFDLGGPQPGSDNRNRLILIYREGDERHSIAVPAASATLPYDVAGPYRGVRLTREAAVLFGLLPPIEGIVADAVFRNGQDVPSTFVVGARTRGLL